MPNPLYFFTEADKLSSQVASKAFGAQSNTKYNLGSFHSAASSPKVIAVTDGYLFAVEQDSTHLNLVLVPVRPVGRYLPNIFCFVYKGVKKSSLLSSDGNYIGDAELNDLTFNIHENYAQFGESSEWGTESEPLIFSDALIPYSGKGGSSKIRDLLRNTDLDSLYVGAGLHIGDFDHTDFGFEVIMERWESQPDLDSVGTGERYLEVDYINPLEYYLSTNADIFKNKMAREEVLDYMDPAAFYGSFLLAEGINRLDYISGGEVKRSNKEELYDDIISKFYNHDVIYVDLRNSLNYSMNLFDHLSDNVVINPGSSPRGRRTVNYRRSNWPMLTIKPEDFIAPSTGQWSDYSAFLNIELPAGADLPAPESYIHCHELARELNRRSRVNNYFVNDLSTDSSSGVYNIVIGKRNSDSHVDLSSAYIPICSYIRITYGTNYPGRFADLVNFSENIHLVQNHLDQLFIPFSTDTLPTGRQNMIIDKFTDDRMIVYQPGLNSSIICERGIAIGTEVVTFFAYPIKRALRKYDQNRMEFNIESMNSYGSSNLLELISSSFSSVEVFSGYLEFASESAIPFNRLEQFRDDASRDPDISELISLTITREEYAAIKTLRDSSGFSDCFPVYFGVLPDAVDAQDKYRRSFTRFNLVLRGMAEVDGDMEVKEVDTNKKITYAHN